MTDYPYPENDGLPLPIYHRACEFADELIAVQPWLFRGKLRRGGLARSWWWCVSEAEAEARCASSDMPYAIAHEIEAAENAHYAAQMIDDAAKWERVTAETSARLANARKAASDWRAAKQFQPAEEIF